MKLGKVFGKDIILKKSEGEFFLSGSPMREPTEKQLEQREKFTKATATCKAESKLKKGSVWGVSDYNTCIRKELTKKKEK